MSVTRLLKFLRRVVGSALLLVAIYHLVQFNSMDVSAAIKANNWSYARFPVHAKDFVFYVSPFGWRPSTGSQHNGIDIGVDLDKEVLAWWSGTVKVADFTPGCGGEVFIVSGNWDSRFCHLNKILVKPGQTVKAGDVVALSGSTGNSQGPHLHWEIRYKENLIDPGVVIKHMMAADKGETLQATESQDLIQLKRDDSCHDCMI